MMLVLGDSLAECSLASPGNVSLDHLSRRRLGSMGPGSWVARGLKVLIDGEIKDHGDCLLCRCCLL